MEARRRTSRPPRHLAINLFGAVCFSFEGQPWRFSAPPRTLPLLAYLILHRNKALNREAVAFALWPDDDEASARSNLRRHLLYLRNALPEPASGRPWIVADGRTSVRWNGDAACSVDVVAFERLSGREESLEAAAALYVGDLLAALSDDWVIAERERLRDMHMSNLGRLVAVARRDGDFTESLRFAHQMLALDPWREDALRHVMELRYALGDRAGALAEYERFAARLQDDLQAMPMPESVTCYESLLHDAPVPYSRIDGAFIGGERGTMALLPFVGRERELETLQLWWTRAARGNGNVGLIGGEAGIGKTRLLGELKTLAESEGGRVLMGASASSGDVGYGPFAQALSSAVPLLQTANVDPLWLAVAGDLIPGLAGKCGLPQAPPIESGQERNRLFEATFHLLHAIAQQRPLLLILEDVHWSTEGTLDLIHYLDGRIADTRILIVASYRDEEVARAHPLRRLRRKLDRAGHAVRLMLAPIDLDAVHILVAKLRKRIPALAKASGALYARSQGSPLFLAQLVASCADGATLNEDPSSVPRGLRDVVVERLSRLSADTRSLAMMASVIGNAFDVELLRELTGWSDERVSAGLGELLDRHLIHDTGLRPGGDYTFSHHLIETVVYGEASQHDLKRRHERIAFALEELYADRLEDLSLRIAQQYERSSRTDRAAAFYAMAGRAALTVFAYDDAIARSTRGLGLAATDREEVELLLVREAALAKRGEFVERERDLDALIRLRPAEATVACDIHRRRVELYHATDRRQEEESALLAFEDLAHRSGLPDPVRIAAYLRARYLMVCSRCPEALTIAVSALELASEQGDRVAQTQCLCLMVDISDRCGDFVAARQHLERARTLSEDCGDPSVQISVLFMACRLANWQNRYAEVRTLAMQMLEVARTSGDRNRQASALNALGVASLYAFDVADARRYFTEAEELSKATGRPRNVVAARMNQVLLDTRLGLFREAIATAKETMQLAAACGAQLFEESVANMLAEALLRAGDVESAERAVLRAREATRASNSKNRVPTHFALARCQAARGDFQRAIATMNEGLDLLERADLQVYSADANATLASFYLQAGMLGEAVAATRLFADLLTNETSRFEEPDALHWIAAQVYRAAGDETTARIHVDRAWSIYRERLSKIPDRPSKDAYCSMADHRALEAEHRVARQPSIPVTS